MCVFRTLPPVDFISDLDEDFHARLMCMCVCVCVYVCVCIILWHKIGEAENLLMEKIIQMDRHEASILGIH